MVNGVCKQSEEPFTNCNQAIMIDFGGYVGGRGLTCNRIEVCGRNYSLIQELL